MRRRVGPLRVVQLLRPAHSPRYQEWSRGRRCRGVHATTRSFPLRVEQLLRPAYGPRSQEWSRGRRCRDAHASTQSLSGPSTAGGPGWAHGDDAASYSAVQLRRGPRTAHCPSWSRGRRCPAEHAARCRSCGVAYGVVNQVGPSGKAHGSSELVKAHTPRRGRPSCCNSSLPILSAVPHAEDDL